MTTIPLGSVPSGEDAEIVRICAGCRATSRLYELGLTPGTTVKIIANDFHGPIIFEVRGSRLSLGRGISERVSVRG